MFEDLTKLEAGQAVVLYAPFRSEPAAVVPVERTTPTQIIANNIRFRRDTGREVGQRYSGWRISSADPAIVAEARALIRRKNTDKKLGNVDWSKLSDDTINKVLELITSELQGGA